MPPRSFPAIVPDRRILEVFATSKMPLKAHRVMHLLGLPRSKIRNIQSALQRLARIGQLVEQVSLSEAQPHHLYTRSLPDVPCPASAHAPDQSKPVLDVCLDTTCATTASPTPCNPVEEMFNTESQSMMAAMDGVAVEVENTTPAPLCVVCRDSWPTGVLLPCRHQACCKACWLAAVARERRIHKKHERLKRELGPSDRERCAFLPRCPVCRVAVEDVVSPYTNI
jgi:hypothetical protein